MLLHRVALLQMVLQRVNKLPKKITHRFNAASRNADNSDMNFDVCFGLSPLWPWTRSSMVERAFHCLGERCSRKSAIVTIIALKARAAIQQSRSSLAFSSAIRFRSDGCSSNCRTDYLNCSVEGQRQRWKRKARLTRHICFGRSQASRLRLSGSKIFCLIWFSWPSQLGRSLWFWEQRQQVLRTPGATWMTLQNRPPSLRDLLLRITKRSMIFMLRMPAESALGCEEDSPEIWQLTHWIPF